jgi:hypothetical protein
VTKLAPLCASLVLAACSGAPVAPDADPAGPQAADARGNPPIESLAFLAGCWRVVTPAGVMLEENYLGPVAGLVMGVVRETRDGRLTFHEFIRIRAAADGVYYEPYPDGERSPVRFKLEEARQGYARFANPEHDFPQRIEYARRGSRLTTTVQGWRGTEPVRQSYTTTRGRCERTRREVGGGTAPRDLPPRRIDPFGDPPRQ